MEVFVRLEALEQVLALLAAVAVEHVDRQSLEIEIDAVAEEQHQCYGHDDDDTEAARIAQDMQDLFSGDGQQAREAHGLRPSAASLAVVIETKTSSRVGRIFSMRWTVTPWALRYAWMRGSAATAS